MELIYCDNGSTSFPKAPGLGKVMGEHIDNNGYNISRGGYNKAYGVEFEIIEAREKLVDFFGADNIKNVIFTPGATMSLNMIINGLLKPGDHVITTSMEHNAVVRPIYQLEQKGLISWTRLQCRRDGTLDPQLLRDAIRPETKLVCVIHGSNVSGSIMPIKEMGEICREKNIFYAIDVSQTAGNLPVNMKEVHADAIAFPGHKGLLGPQGIGGLILSDAIGDAMEPVYAGGTGSESHLETMPKFMPDKFQPGTINIPGIIGLSHAVGFIQKEGLDAIVEKKDYMTRKFLEGVRNIDGLYVTGPEGDEERCSCVSIDFTGNDNGEVAYTLESEYGIMTRVGLHCAPHAHKTLGTYPQGTVRFAFGYFNKEEEIKKVIDAINNVAKG